MIKNYIITNKIIVPRNMYGNRLFNSKKFKIIYLITLF